MLSDLSRVYAYSYLTAEPTQGYLRRPLEPHPPKSPQFHRPPEDEDEKTGARAKIREGDEIRNRVLAKKKKKRADGVGRSTQSGDRARVSTLWDAVHE
ncbi:hypothetical protein HPB52_006210 [Rhipicephalus sanguineus]|uniref:Uncharacterized protein n=1 Tax=Rhipicephalus sanguineus TaxID=34632 RepID=A0A9D4QIM3_RHISA|nr:hypothetical protein HPB52_006210 [Rhipicephalus sanguineus]